ncbi:MAG TPA: hypothetical protein VM487_09635 [Phycisphaerae bacterium]|nr:hypothetical protein [Phycisphaerae bacterium]
MSAYGPPPAPNGWGGGQQQQMQQMAGAMQGQRMAGPNGYDLSGQMPQGMMGQGSGRRRRPWEQQDQQEARPGPLSGMPPASGGATPPPGMGPLGMPAVEPPQGSLQPVSRAPEQQDATAQYAQGGYVRGPGGPRSDSIPARLSNGEGVLTAPAVQRLGGPRAIDMMNHPQRFADGGIVRQPDQVPQVSDTPPAPTNGPTLNNGMTAAPAGRSWVPPDPRSSPTSRERRGYWQSTPATPGFTNNLNESGNAQAYSQANLDEMARLQGQSNTYDTRSNNAFNTALQSAGNMPAPYQFDPASQPAPFERGDYASTQVMPSPYQWTGQMPSPYQWTGQMPSMGPYDPNEMRAQYTANSNLNGGGSTTAQDSAAGNVADYSGAFRDYAVGANNQFQTAFQQNLRNMTGGAASRGRLNTGFFDEDTGRLARQMGGDFTAAQQAQALNAANLSLQAGQTNANNQTQVGIQNANRRLAADQGNQMYGNQSAQFLTDYGLRAQGQDYSQVANQRDYGLGEQSQAFGQGANQRDYGLAESGQNYSNALNAANLNYNTWAGGQQLGLAAQGQNYGQSANQRDYAQGAYQYQQGNANDQRNTYLDLLNSNYDRYENTQRYQNS